MIAENVPVFVGLDYHQASVQTCVVDASGAVLTNRRCRNDAAEIVATIRRCGQPAAVVAEACNGSAALLDEITQATGWSVQLGHPGYANRMKLNPDKTDYGDARLLADLTRAGYLPQVWLAPARIRELRRLVRYRQTSVQDVKACKLRITSLLRARRIVAPPGTPGRWSKGWLRWLDAVPMSENDRWVIDEDLQKFDEETRRLRRTEARLSAFTAGDPVIARLRTINNIGPVTAWLFRAEIGDFRRFRTGKQLSRFCGTSPRNCSSGERVADSGLIRAGNPFLKTVIIQAAQRLARFHPHWRAFAARKLAEGKAYNAVVAAIANRWVRWLFHQMKESIPVD